MVDDSIFNDDTFEVAILKRGKPTGRWYPCEIIQYLSTDEAVLEIEVKNKKKEITIGCEFIRRTGSALNLLEEDAQADQESLLAQEINHFIQDSKEGEPPPSFPIQENNTLQNNNTNTNNENDNTNEIQKRYNTVSPLKEQFDLKNDENHINGGGTNITTIKQVNNVNIPQSMSILDNEANTETSESDFLLPLTTNFNDEQDTEKANMIIQSLPFNINEQEKKEINGKKPFLRLNIKEQETKEIRVKNQSHTVGTNITTIQHLRLEEVIKKTMYENNNNNRLPPNSNENKDEHVQESKKNMSEITEVDETKTTSISNPTNEIETTKPNMTPLTPETPSMTVLTDNSAALFSNEFELDDFVNDLMDKKIHEDIEIVSDDFIDSFVDNMFMDNISMILVEKENKDDDETKYLVSKVDKTDDTYEEIDDTMPEEDQEIIEKTIMLSDTEYEENSPSEKPPVENESFSRMYVEHTHEIAVLQQGEPTGSWVPCRITETEETKGGIRTVTVMFDNNSFSNIPETHIRPLPLHWTHEILLDFQANLDWLPCVILENDQEKDTVKIFIKDELVPRRVQASNIRPLTLEWTHEVSVLFADGTETGKWLKCIILAEFEDHRISIHVENGTVVDYVPKDHLRLIELNWTHEVRLIHEFEENFLHCTLLGQPENGYITIHCENGLITTVDLEQVKLLQTKRFDHKVAILNNDGTHTGEWLSCCIEEVFDNDTVAITTEMDDEFIVPIDQVLSIREENDLIDRHEDEILKLLQSPTGKAWFETLCDVTIHGYDGQNVVYSKGVRFLVTNFEGNTAKVSEPVFGWTYLYNEQNEFVYKFVEDWEEPISSSDTSWYDYGRSIMGRMKDGIAKLEKESELIPETEYEIVNEVGCTVREGYSLASSHIAKLPPRTIVTVVEMHARRARITKPLAGWVSMKSQQSFWFIQKYEPQLDLSDSEQSEEEELNAAELSIFDLENFKECESHPEFNSLKDDFLRLKKANIILNQQLCNKDKKLLKLEKRYRRKVKKIYGIHSNFWEELGKKKEKTRGRTECDT